MSLWTWRLSHLRQPTSKKHVPLDVATLALASADLEERARYLIRLGKLMLNWRTHNERPAFLCRAQLEKRREEFTAAERQQLEVSLTRYYMQAL